jgi:hypothetical protein
MSDEADQLAREIGWPTVTVTVGDIPAEDFLVILPSPGGARLFASETVHMQHAAAVLRGVAEIIEAQRGACDCEACR